MMIRQAVLSLVLVGVLRAQYWPSSCCTQSCCCPSCSDCSRPAPFYEPPGACQCDLKVCARVQTPFDRFYYPSWPYRAWPGYQSSSYPMGPRYAPTPGGYARPAGYPQPLPAYPTS